MSGRKIVHVDMDAFYASVEQRDNPELRGKPVVVAWRGKRSVVCAASYEARRFGVRSTMAATYAERLCPQAIFVPPDFTRYRAVSRAVREIFLRYTELIEPLSLDEAYLDVTENKAGIATATKVASTIRQQIREELNLSASAGVAPNKFLAKIASDWRKPNGLFVVQPAEVESFLTPLPVGRIPGVGKVTEAKLAKLGMRTVGELRTRTLEQLQRLFGRYGQRLYELARGIDESPVVPNRPTKSISAEDTFEQDVKPDGVNSRALRQDIADYKTIMREAQNLIADNNIDFVFVHLPIPHPPGIYDRQTEQLCPCGNYLDNLALADKTAGLLMSEVNHATRGSRTTVIISSDHSWRVAQWRNSSGLSPEEERVFETHSDPRPVFLIHFPGQDSGTDIKIPFAEMTENRIVASMLQGQISGPNDPAGWWLSSTTLH